MSESQSVLRNENCTELIANRLVRSVPMISLEVFVRTPVGRSGEERIDSEQRKKLFDNVDGLFAEIDGGTGEEIAPEQLRAAGCPITHVVGQNSAPFLAAAAERLAKVVPTVHILRVPDADHLALSEQPERFLALLRPLV